MQTELIEDDARLWRVRFSYQRYVRFRGCLVQEQVREERAFPAASAQDAARCAREFLSDRFAAEFKALGYNLANLQPGRHLTLAKSFRLKTVSQ